MATQDYTASVQGVALRLTKLDANGNLLTGPTDSYTTSAFIRVSFTPEYEEGDEITEKAADGTVCVSYKAPDTLKRVNLEIAICNPDPELSNLLSGGLLLEQGGQSVGWASAQVGEEPTPNGVAVEVWSRAIKNGKPAGDKPYFHWVFPFVKTRLSGDRVIENGLLATTFEGFGLGNINFRSGPDGTWYWPAATDRPYLYARSEYAPEGLEGFYTWTPGAPTGAAGAPQLPGKPFSTETNAVDVGGTGTNVPNSQSPYPYNDKYPTDAVLSVRDFQPNASGPLEHPAPADQQDVRNVSPTNQPPVTYNARNFQITPGGASAGGQFFVAKPPPGNLSPQQFAFGGGQMWTTPAPTGTTAGNTQVMNSLAAQLPALGFKALPTSPWLHGWKITVDGFDFHWDGAKWAPGEAP